MTATNRPTNVFEDQDVTKTKSKNMSKCGKILNTVTIISLSIKLLHNYQNQHRMVLSEPTMKSFKKRYSPLFFKGIIFKYLKTSKITKGRYVVKQLSHSLGHMHPTSEWLVQVLTTLFMI